MAAERSEKDLGTDQATGGDRLPDADFDTSVVTSPKKTPRVALNMRIEPEVVTLAKQVAKARHLDAYTQLLKLYIREGLERDRPLLDEKKS